MLVDEKSWEGLLVCLEEIWGKEIVCGGGSNLMI